MKRIIPIVGVVVFSFFLSSCPDFLSGEPAGRWNPADEQYDAATDPDAGGDSGITVTISGSPIAGTSVQSVTWTWEANTEGCSFQHLVNQTPPEDFEGFDGVFNAETTAVQSEGDGLYYLYVRALGPDGNIFSKVATASALLDNTAPANITTVSASAGMNIINLDWSNPDDSDFSGVKIVYDTDSNPVNMTDGTFLIDTADEYFMHSELVPQTSYFYTIFTYDSTGNVSTGTSIDSSPLGPEISSWENINPFPDERFGFLGVECRGNLYVIGGRKDNPRYTTVYYAAINENNSVGTWNTTTPIFKELNNFTGFSFNNRIYMFHGDDGGACINDVKYAEVNPDGTLAEWKTAADLPPKT